MVIGLLVGMLSSCAGAGFARPGLRQTATSSGSWSARYEASFAGKKSLIVAWDGVRVDALIQADTPNLDALRDGTWVDGYHGSFTTSAYALTDAHAWSLPNHWAIMTGANARQSGVQDNDDIDAGDSRRFPHYLTMLEQRAPTLATAYLFTWPKDLMIDCACDYIKLSDDVSNVRRVVEILAGTHRDDVGSAGTRWSYGRDPDAIFLFLDGPDYAGHRHGFTSSAPEYIAGLEAADAQLGQILAAVRARPGFAEEDWQIILTSDHGGTAAGHGGQTEIEQRIPFLVVSRSVAQGSLPPYDVKTRTGTRNLDVVPTVLAHFGLDKPGHLSGSSRAF